MINAAIISFPNKYIYIYIYTHIYMFCYNLSLNILTENPLANQFSFMY